MKENINNLERNFSQDVQTELHVMYLFHIWTLIQKGKGRGGRETLGVGSKTTTQTHKTGLKLQAPRTERTVFWPIRRCYTGHGVTRVTWCQR